MCMFCGGSGCGGLGNFLMPILGATTAMVIIKFENKVKGWIRKKLGKKRRDV